MSVLEKEKMDFLLFSSLVVGSYLSLRGGALAVCCLDASCLLAPSFFVLSLLLFASGKMTVLIIKIIIKFLLLFTRAQVEF